MNDILVTILVTDCFVDFLGRPFRMGRNHADELLTAGDRRNGIEICFGVNGCLRMRTAEVETSSEGAAADASSVLFPGRTAMAP